MNGGDFLHLIRISAESFTKITPGIILTLLLSFRRKLINVGLSIP